jgi:hypothetical protein
VMLQVVTPQNQAAGAPQNPSPSSDWDLLTEIVKEAHKQRVLVSLASGGRYDFPSGVSLRLLSFNSEKCK